MSTDDAFTRFKQKPHSLMPGRTPAGHDEVLSLRFVPDSASCPGQGVLCGAPSEPGAGAESEARSTGVQKTTKIQTLGRVCGLAPKVAAAARRNGFRMTAIFSCSRQASSSLSQLGHDGCLRLTFSASLPLALSSYRLLPHERQREAVKSHDRTSASPRHFVSRSFHLAEVAHATCGEGRLARIATPVCSQMHSSDARTGQV